MNTNAMFRNLGDLVMDNTLKAKLSLITKKATLNRTLKFIALIHLLNDEEYLYECLRELKRGKATGIDKRTNSQSIHFRGQWETQTARHTYTVMDEVVQLAVAKILDQSLSRCFSMSHTLNYETQKCYDNSASG